MKLSHVFAIALFSVTTSCRTADNMLESRRLTKSEKEMVKGVFGREARTRIIRLHASTDSVFIKSGTDAMVGDIDDKRNVIFYGKKLPDYARAAPTISGLFMHEITHIWQNQNDHRYTADFCFTAIHGRKCYEYTLKDSSAFNGFNNEQQGQIIQDYTRRFMPSGFYNGFPRNELTASDSLLMKVVEARFPAAKKTREKLEQRRQTAVALKIQKR